MCLVEMSPNWIKWALNRSLEFSQEVTQRAEGDKTRGGHHMEAEIGVRCLKPKNADDYQ